MEKQSCCGREHSLTRTYPGLTNVLDRMQARQTMLSGSSVRQKPEQKEREILE